MKEIALVTLITENGDEVIIDGYNNIDDANDRVADLLVQTGDPSYYVQYVQLH